MATQMRHLQLFLWRPWRFLLMLTFNVVRPLEPLPRFLVQKVPAYTLLSMTQSSFLYFCLDYHLFCGTLTSVVDFCRFGIILQGTRFLGSKGRFLCLWGYFVLDILEAVTPGGNPQGTNGHRGGTSYPYN